MAQAPIKSPVGGRTELDRLKESNPAAYQAYLDSHPDTPANVRDRNEHKKKPYRPDRYTRS